MIGAFRLLIQRRESPLWLSALVPIGLGLGGLCLLLTGEPFARFGVVLFPSSLRFALTIVGVSACAVALPASLIDCVLRFFLGLHLGVNRLVLLFFAIAAVPFWLEKAVYLITVVILWMFG